MTVAELSLIPLPRGIADLTANELAWVEFIRLASAGTDPAPTLGRVQQLQIILRDAMNR